MASILNATTTSGLVTSADNSGSLQLQTNNGTTAVTIDTSQNVGIGTTSPTKKLFVSDSTFGAVGVYRDLDVTSVGAAGQFIEMGAKNGSTFTPGAAIVGVLDNPATTGYLRFDTRSGSALAERMRITSGGNLLVNKTATNFTDSGLQLDNNSGNAGRVVCTKSASGSYSVFVNYHAGTYVGGIDMSNTATGFPTSSDIRLKKNIVDCPNALDKVNQMRIVSHDWKVDDSHVEYGVIAQELEPIAPQAVKKGDDGETVEQTWAVDYSKLVPILVKAIQELKAELDATKAEVQALKGVA